MNDKNGLSKDNEVPIICYILLIYCIDFEYKFKYLYLTAN